MSKVVSIDFNKIQLDVNSVSFRFSDKTWMNFDKFCSSNLTRLPTNTSVIISSLEKEKGNLLGLQDLTDLFDKYIIDYKIKLTNDYGLLLRIEEKNKDILFVEFFYRILNSNGDIHEKTFDRS